MNERCKSFIITACLTKALSFVVSCVMWERHQDKIDSREIVKRHHSQVKFYWIELNSVLLWRRGTYWLFNGMTSQKIVDLACIIRWGVFVRHSPALIRSPPDGGRLEVNFYRSCMEKIHNSPIIPFERKYISFVTQSSLESFGLFAISSREGPWRQLW